MEKCGKVLKVWECRSLFGVFSQSSIKEILIFSKNNGFLKKDLYTLTVLRSSLFMHHEAVYWDILQLLYCSS